MTYPTPPAGSILIPQVDEMPRSIARYVEELTGVDVYNDPDAPLALAWYYGRHQPWYAGITFSYVREHWTTTMTKTITRRGPKPWRRGLRKRRS